MRWIGLAGLGVVMAAAIYSGLGPTLDKIDARERELMEERLAEQHREAFRSNRLVGVSVDMAAVLPTVAAPENRPLVLLPGVRYPDRTVWYQSVPLTRLRKQQVDDLRPEIMFAGRPGGVFLLAVGPLTDASLETLTADGTDPLEICRFQGEPYVVVHQENVEPLLNTPVGPVYSTAQFSKAELGLEGSLLFSIGG